MKIKCGTDIIEISRIKEGINELGERFLNRIYTKKEIFKTTNFLRGRKRMGRVDISKTKIHDKTSKDNILRKLNEQRL